MQGLPNTIEWLGTSQLTYLFGAIKTSSLIFILPTIVAFIPIQTSLPITGVPCLPTQIRLSNENTTMYVYIYALALGLMVILYT